MLTREEAFSGLSRIMARYSAQGSPEQFQAVLNRVFHDQEAGVYDELHRDMWEQLPIQFVLLCQAAQERSNGDEPVRLLDIGCGTGLATELFARTRVGQNIESVRLLDTSEEMLSRGKARTERLGLRSETTCGTIHDLSEGHQFNFVVASSVLHHIPDLGGFFQSLSHVMKPGGFFLHFQDINADANLSILKARERQRNAADLPSFGLRRAAKFLGFAKVARSAQAAAYRMVGKTFDPNVDRYIEKTNLELIRLGVIGRPMSSSDIWAVTDIQIHGAGKGISLGELTGIMPGFDLVSARSYGFFGQRPPVRELAERERRLVEQGDMDGSLLAGLWQKTAATLKPLRCQ